MQALRTSNAIQKVLIAGSEIAEARFMAASWKWNAITSVGVFCVTSGINMYKMFQGQISFKQFVKLEMQQATGAVGSLLLGVAGSKVGIAVGATLGPAGAVIGGAVGGIIGAIIGQIGGEAIMEWIQSYYPWFDEDEDKEKVALFVESMIILDTPGLDDLKSEEINRLFRKKALQCHPDKLPRDATEEERKLVYENWYAVEMARDMLLQYCQDPSMLTLQLKKKIKKCFQKDSEEVDMAAFAERMKNWNHQSAQRALELKKTN